jgi:hypothetical protein
MFALVLIFSLTNGHSQVVDPGYLFATKTECHEAAAVARGMIVLRQGQTSFVIECRRR